MANGKWLTKAVIIAVSSAATVAFAGAVYAIIVGYPSLAQEVDVQEKDIRKLEQSQGALAKNQRVMDEAVRDLKADSEWTQKKLDALLEHEGITERIPRPKLKPSELEEVE